MPQFNVYPALQGRGIDIQGIQRQSLQNQLLESKLQQAQNPQPDPRLALAREKFQFSQNQDQRAQGLQHVKVLGQFAGAAARASGLQRVMIHGEAVKYAQANRIPTDGWRDPGDPEYVAWAQAQQARAGEAAEQGMQYSGDPQFDKNVGKFYQTNPKTGKREYVSSPSGMDIDVDKDGNVSVRTGVGRGGKGGGKLGRRAQGEVETKILSVGETMAQITSIRNRYKPEYQELGTRWDAFRSKWKSKLGFEVGPEDRQLLRDYSAYRADAGQLFALTLKDLSGVAVNPTEFKRAEAWLPNPGTGLFDGDAPDELTSKLDRFEEFTRRALMKYAFINKNGLTINDVDVDDMPSKMRSRGNEIAKNFQKDGLTGDALKQAVKYRLADEFGLAAQ